MSQPQVGILLAAGLGTRLRPATDFRPKPLIPVAGLEPLFFALYRMRAAGLRRVVVNSHHLSECVEARLRDWSPLLSGLEIRRSVERPEILGTGGALLKIFRDFPDWFSDTSVIVQNADTLARINLGALLDKPDRNAMAVSRSQEHLSKYGPLWTHSDGERRGQWAAAGSKNGGPGLEAGHFLGVHTLSRTAVKRLQSAEFPTRSIDLFSGVYEPLIREGHVFVAEEYFRPGSTDEWFDMNNPEFLLEAQTKILERLERDEEWQLALQARHPGLTHPQPGVWVKGAGPRKARPPLVWVEDAPEAWGEPWDVTAGPGTCVVVEKGARHPPIFFEAEKSSLLICELGASAPVAHLRSAVAVW